MAILWDDDHSTPRRLNRWQLRRTPRGGKIEAWAISDRPIGVWTHYYGGRTTPCRAESCMACQEGQTSRKHWYLAALDRATGDKFLLELTDRGADGLLSAIGEDGSMRGKLIRTWRINSRPNAAVESYLGDQVPSHIKIPPQPNIRDCLCIIWDLDQQQTEVEPGEVGSVVRPHRRRRKTNGSTTAAEAAQLPKPVDPGRSRGSDNVHEPEGQTRDLPPRAAAESTEPAAGLPAAKIHTNGRGLVEFD